MGLRCFLAVGVIAAFWLVPDRLTAQTGPQPPGGEPWYQRMIVGMEVGPTGAQFGHSDPSATKYAQRFNGRDIVRKCVAANAEYLVIWARDGDWAYYDSKVARKCPGLGERDVLRETMEEAQAHNLPIIAYCVVQQGGHFLKEHPEFEMSDSSGNRIGRFCLNSGYLEVMKQLLAEQLAYGIDGFHIDMLDQGFGPPYGCWCQHCQRQFQSRYGRKMPSGVTWDEDWDRMMQFRYDTSERFEQSLTEFIRETSPTATVDYNYHGNPPFSWEVGQRPVQHAGNGDFVTGETGVWGFSALTVGLNAQIYRAAFPDHPYQVAIQRGVRMYHDQTTRPLHDMRWETFTLLSHGAFVTMIDKTAYDGWLDPVAYRRIGRVLGEARAKRAHFGHRPIYEVGLYFSSRSRDWIARDKPETYFQSFQGAHKSCVLEHLPFGVVLDENVTLASLQQFPVICLPDAGIVSEPEVALLKQYVELGGSLLITGHAGQYDRLGNRLAESSLSELIGGKVRHPLKSADNWVRFSNSDQGSDRTATDSAIAISLMRGIAEDWPFLVKGPATVYEPTTAIGWGELLKPDRTPLQLSGVHGTDWPMSADQVVGPAVLVNTIGEGTVVTLAASADFATASEHHIVEARKLFRNVVRMLNPQPIVEVLAPANVEAVITNDADHRTLRIHLIAYNPTPQTTPPTKRPYILPGLIEDCPIYRLKIVTRQPIQEVMTCAPSTQVEVEARQISALIEDIHEVIVIQY
jgi:hypothetical protein